LVAAVRGAASISDGDVGGRAECFRWRRWVRRLALSVVAFWVATCVFGGVLGKGWQPLHVATFAAAASAVGGVAGASGWHCRSWSWGRRRVFSVGALEGAAAFSGGDAGDRGERCRRRRWVRRLALSVVAFGVAACVVSESVGGGGGRRR